MELCGLPLVRGWKAQYAHEVANLLERVGRYFEDVLPASADVQERLERAEGLLVQERWDDALGVLQPLLAERPTIASVWLGVVKAQSAQGERAAALRTLQEGRTANPTDAQLALLEAELALDSGDLSRASAAASDAVREARSDQRTTFLRASMLLAQAERGLGRPHRASWALMRAQEYAHRARPLWHQRVAALREGADLDGLRGAYEKALADELSGEERLDLARSALETGFVATAIQFVEHPFAKRTASLEAARLLVLAEIELARDECADAKRLVRAALEQEPETAAAHRVLGEIHRKEGNADKTAGAFLLSLESLVGRPQTLSASVAQEVLHSAQEVAVGASLVEPDVLRRCRDALAAFADRGRQGEGGDPGDAGSRILDMRDFCEAFQQRSDAFRWAKESVTAAGALPVGAKGLSRQSWITPPSMAWADARTIPRQHLLGALDALLDGHVDRTIEACEKWREASRGWTQPDGDEVLAHAIRELAWRGTWGTPVGDYAPLLLAEFLRGPLAFLGDAEIDEELSWVIADAEHPIVVSVMGEFNAGKSTFINALVGKPVAPTGIVPTTSAIEWFEVDLGTKARLVDTPGINAPDAAHEPRAVSALERADVVVWLIDASQAGKATEAEFLARVRARNKVLVPVLNKVDRLSKAALDEVLALLRQDPLSFDGTFPISAQRAYAAKLDGDREELAASGVPGLRAHLEEMVGRNRGNLKERRTRLALGSLLVRGREVCQDKLNCQTQHVADLVAAHRETFVVPARLERCVERALEGLEAWHDGWLLSIAQECRWLLDTGIARGSSEKWDLRTFLLEYAEREIERWAAALTDRLADEWHAELGRGSRLKEPASPVGANLIRTSASVPLAWFCGAELGLLRGGGLDGLLRRGGRRDSPSAMLDALKGSRQEALRTGLAAGVNPEPLQRLRHRLNAVASEVGEVVRTARARDLRRANAEDVALRWRVLEPLDAVGRALEARDS